MTKSSHWANCSNWQQSPLLTNSQIESESLILAGNALRLNEMDIAPSAPIWLVMRKNTELPQAHISEIVQMALSDHVSFADIRREYGLAEKEVKTLMRQNLKPGSYRAWRKRVSTFGDRRQHYK